MADKLRKYKSLYSSTTNTFSTGESVTITPASVVGLPTDTEITLTFDRVDGSGTKTPSKMERIRGTVVGSNFVVSASGRAVEGTEQTHTSPVVEMVWNADDLNDIVDWGLVEHGQDGKHTSALVTTLKATGAVVNTGTSDVTIVTPKALADSDYAKTTDITVTADSTTTFTNKTFDDEFRLKQITTPSNPASGYNKLYFKSDDKVYKLTSGGVETEIGATTSVVDGWTSVTGSWSYASATTITVPSGAASLYQIGDKIKLTQTTVKYFYVIGVADTVLTVTGGSDYTVANAAITSPYYSHQNNPIGFPRYFLYTPTYTGFSSDPNTAAKFSISGKQVSISIIDLSAGTSNAGGFTMTIIGTANIYSQSLIDVVDNGTHKTGYYQIDTNGTTVTFYSSNGKAGFATSGSKTATGWITYFI